MATARRSAASPSKPPVAKAAKSPRMRAEAREAVPAAPSGDKSNSLTRSVYLQLRADLLNGHYRPGEKLRAEVLRRRFNIGSSPIREALNRLLAEGFVALEEQKGFSVAPVSGEELLELVRARALIDGAAVTESIKHYDTAWEEGLVLALHRLTRVARRTPEAGADDPEWEKLHRAFHCALVAGCGSRWLRRVSEQLFDAAERYRLLAAGDLSPRNELEEHRAITQACLERRPDDAVRLLEEHYSSTSRSIMASFAEGDRR
ncbi:MAG TPA: FCD domain-containing protein [Caulobacteraceae bacterium]|jgi:DNA-binding GntR family transcriptional regulator|nr:FCD domain-containing protein [Caulobacteraceae bacterium]